MSWKDILLCSVLAVALPVGQVMFKWAALYSHRLEGPFLFKVIQNVPLIGAFAWYGLTALFWFYVLTRVPLSSAYVFSIFGSALVPVAAWLIFKEPMSWRLAVGYALMLGGALVIMPTRA